MFRSHSDHLQGAHIFLIKVTDFNFFLKCKKLVWWCGSITVSELLKAFINLLSDNGLTFIKSVSIM